jgi:hypothetical protein
MATISNKIESVFGNKRIVRFDAVFTAFATGGASLTAADIGLERIELLLIAPNGGKEFTYNYSTSKVKAFQQPAYGTPTGTFSVPAITVTAGDVTVTGGASAAVGSKLRLTTDTATGALAKAITGDLTIPQATFGIPVETAALATGPVFTGVANAQAAMTEVTGSISVTLRCFAMGL